MKKYIKKQRIICLLLALCIIFTFSACSGDDNGDATDTDTAYNSSKIRIATKNTPEQNILATLAKILIREKIGVEAEIVYFEDSTSAICWKKWTKAISRSFLITAAPLPKMH